MKYKIKICGITNRDDLELIARCGADYGGGLIEIESPRGLTLETAQDLFCDPPLPMVALVLDHSLEKMLRFAEMLHPAVMQLHGYESAETVAALKAQVDCEIWKVIHLPAADNDEPVDVDGALEEIERYTQAGADCFLVDATVTRQGKKHLGGTGKTVDWQAAKTIKERIDKPFIVAGGITPGNVTQAVRVVQPYAVDLSSGVELTKGKKDPDKVLDLITKVRACEDNDIC
jgi:phosphoribosylanthranilate isomerase